MCPLLTCRVSSPSGVPWWALRFSFSTLLVLFSLTLSVKRLASSCALATPPCFISEDRRPGKLTDFLQKVWGAVLMGCSQETVITSLLTEILFIRRVW